jgi:hypothetical protein
MEIENFSSGFLDALSQQAEQAIRNRQHKNIHQHYNDSCQRLFNAIGVNSYIRPTTWPWAASPRNSGWPWPHSATFESP